MAASASLGSSAVRPGFQRTVLLGAGLLVLLLAASLVLVDAPAAGPIGVVHRVVAALIGAGGLLGASRAFQASEQVLLRRGGTFLLAVSGSLLVWFLYLGRDGVRGAVISVLVAVLGSATLFVAANRWLDQSTRAWPRFTTTSGLVLGGVLALLLVGNRSIGFFAGTAGSRVDRSVWLIPVFMLVGAAYGLAIGALTGPLRVPVATLGGTGVGVLVGTFLRVGSRPALDVTTLVATTLIGALLLAGVARLRARDPIRASLLGAALGWFLGSFGFPDLGVGTSTQGLLATTVLGALTGTWLGLAPARDLTSRLRMEARIRAVIFLAPALVFITASLIIPTVRTIYLSFLDARSINFLGLDNFRFIFGQPSFFNIASWRGIFPSTEFLIFGLLLLVSLLLALRQRRTVDGVLPPRLSIASMGAALLVVGSLVLRLTGRDIAPAVWHVLAPLLILGVGVAIVLYLRRHPGNSGFSGAAGALLGLSVLFLSFALFTNLRGTLFNNLWWVVMVTATATGLGLAIAALADRSSGESVAKSIIFMPMALSFVGAGIIWRFMYLARPENRPQTGVLNSLWVGLGNLSVSPRAGTAGAVLLVVAALLVLFGITALRLGAMGTGWMSVLLAGWGAWLGVRFIGGGGIAGVSVVDGQAVVTPLLFISGTQQVGAYNNLFIMIPFIWIYTGFAMVIFSAAIKGVPADLLEAGRVDGATDSQSFWRIVLPQIRPTIGVVLTTIIVVVMKVFDIVKVMTNGNFGTQVLANEMWNRAFLDGNFGVGSAVAVILFLSVLPVMYVNIRRMQKDAA
jgi:ABC-type sugar transport system permease subunit